MPLPLIKRETQLQNEGIVAQSNELSDALFDGIPILPGVVAQNWKLESHVHQSIILSSRIDSTRNFLGPQTNIVRDEVRKITWAAVIENGSLTLVKITASGIQRSVLATENVWRSHIVLDKYSGNIRATWITRSNGNRQLWSDGVPLATAAADPDFPYFDLSQVPIGHVQEQPAAFGVLSYKDRTTGTLYVRCFDGTNFEQEMTLAAPSTIGGMSFAISGAIILARIDALVDERLVPMTARSLDAGATFTPFDPVQFPYGADTQIIPSPPPVVDYLGYFHLPLAATDGATSIAVNMVVEHAFVEAIELPGTMLNTSKVVLERFPKKPVDVVDTSARFGNGITDGLGLIMVMEAGGGLFTSNSQAGGLHFPPGAHLNHEMPKVACYDSTECYTGGVNANTVSMDYMYLETDAETGLPVCGDLHLEMWHMPLPQPVVTATANGGVVNVTITQDANFEPGSTSFSVHDPSVAITNVTLDDARHATITTNVASPGGTASPLRGTTLEFEVRTPFYHHAGEVVIA